MGPEVGIHFKDRSTNNHTHFHTYILFDYRQIDKCNCRQLSGHAWTPAKLKANISCNALFRGLGDWTPRRPWRFQSTATGKRSLWLTHPPTSPNISISVITAVLCKTLHLSGGPSQTVTLTTTQQRGEEARSVALHWLRLLFLSGGATRRCPRSWKHCCMKSKGARGRCPTCSSPRALSDAHSSTTGE